MRDAANAANDSGLTSYSSIINATPKFVAMEKSPSPKVISVKTQSDFSAQIGDRVAADKTYTEELMRYRKSDVVNQSMFQTRYEGFGKSKYKLKKSSKSRLRALSKNFEDQKVQRKKEYFDVMKRIN